MKKNFLLLAFLLLGSWPLLAGNGSESLKAISVTVEREPVDFFEPIFRAYMNIGNEKFTFLIPAKFHMCGDPGQGILKLSQLESDCTITLSRLESAPDGFSETNFDLYHDLVLRLYPAGQIIFQFSQAGHGLKGPAYDLNWKTEDGLLRSSRILFVQTHAGILQISVTSGAKKFTEAQASLNYLLGTFSGTVNGKLIISRLGGRL